MMTMMVVVMMVMIVAQGLASRPIFARTVRKSHYVFGQKRLRADMMNASNEHAPAVNTNVMMHNVVHIHTWFFIKHMLDFHGKARISARHLCLDISNEPMMDIKVFHVPVFVKHVAKISAHCCFVLVYLMRMRSSCCTASYSHDKFTRCVLELCRIDATLPFKTSLVVASVSSQTVSFIWSFCICVSWLLPWESPPARPMPALRQWEQNGRIESQKSSTGSPSTRSTDPMAMISASAELWLTAVCLLDATDATGIGAKVRGPTKAKDNRIVELVFLVSPAKPESENTSSLHWFMGSPGC